MSEITAGEVTELVVDLIRNACVNDGTPDSGQEVRSVETLASYLGAEGQVFEPHPGRQSALYRVPGTEADAPRLMLMGHLDVVPATPSGWTHDPFGGDRDDGFVWGRGAVDMLNVTAAMAAAFKRHLEGDAERLPGDLLFLAVADEEAAGRLGARRLVEHHWDDVACEYLLTEIGTPLLHGAAGVGLPVTAAEKGPQWRRLVARGTPGHGSQPYATANALVPVADAITRLAATPAPVEITDEWRRFVEAWQPGDDLAGRLLDPDRVDDAIDEIAADDIGLARWIHACTHMTISPNVLRAGTKANVVADLAVAEVDVRALPGQDAESVHDHFRKAIGPALSEEVDFEVVEATAATGSAPEGPLWEAMGRALAAQRPDATLIPAMIPVGTDARFFRPRGTIAYGVGLFDDRVGFGDFLRMFHGHDERVSEVSLGMTARLLADTVEAVGTLV
jgi:acetylornithine deacetylase/succinyl-diaminopimelate desuccinylase-like protein